MKRILSVLLLVTISLVWVVESAKNPGLSSPVQESDLNNIKHLISTQLDKVSSDVHSAFYATQALQGIGAVPNQGEAVNKAKDVLKSSQPQKLEAIYHALGVIEATKTEGVQVDKAVVATVKDTIDEIESSLTDLYYAGLSGLILRSIKQQGALSDKELESVIEKVVEYGDEDGTFKNFPSDKEGSAYLAGLALQVVGRLAKGLPSLTNEDKEHVKAVADKAGSLVGLGNDDAGTLSFDTTEDVSSLAATSSVLRGLEAIAATQKSLEDVAGEHVTQLTQFLVNHRGVGSLADAYHLLTGLKAAQNNPIGVPLAVSLERASIVGTAKGAEGHLRVRVTDALDQPVSVPKVFLTKAHPVGKDSHVLIANQELSLTDDKQAYAINFLAAKPDQGFYALEFRVPGSGKYSNIDAAVRTAKVVGSISITDLEVVVADSKEATSKASEGSRYSAKDQSTKIDDVVRIDDVQFVSVSFRVRNAGTNKAVTVQQAFVKFVHSSGHEATFVAHPNDNKVYSIVIGIDEVAKRDLKHLSGDYKLEIVVGDSFIQNPVHWIAAPKVQVKFIKHSAPSKNTGLGALPEIKHEFRKPDSRPPAAVSSLFTILVLAPLGFLFVGFIAMGANISQFPFGGMDFLYAVGFVGSIGAILALMGLYWLRLNLVQTLGYLGVLSIPTVFFGQRALSYLGRRKEKSE